jgi:hypothetical protein
MNRIRRAVRPCAGIICLCLLGEFAVAQSVPFRRGDTNADSSIDVSDAIATLGFLFTGQAAPPCLDSADTNDDGALDISDAITLLSFLFVGGAPIPFPGPLDPCGDDPTADALGCAAFAPCGTGQELFREGASGEVGSVGWILAEGEGFFQVSYEVIDGFAVVEGDIILGTEEDFSNPTSRARSIRAGRQFRWPNGVIPFTIDEGRLGREWDNAQVVQLRIQNAIAHWNQNTLIRIVPRTDEDDFVTFAASDGCASEVGRQGEQQLIHVVDECTIGNLIHEIGHTVGLWHEQSRCDRDDWVDILEQNIEPGKEHNFDKRCEDSLDVGPYDYGSIMHYGPNFFGIESRGTRLTTIQPLRPLPPGVTLGQRNGLSAEDIAGVNFAYSLPQIWIEDFALLVGKWRVDQHLRVLADVNGDGLQDIVGFGDRGVIVSTALPSGAGFTFPATWVEGFAPLAGGWQVGLHPRLMGDVNGDGLQDIVGFGEDGVWVSLSTGFAFTAPGFWLADYGTQSGWTTTEHIRLLADMNGDGLQDIVGFGGSGVLVALSTGGGFTQPTFWVEDFAIHAGGWFVDLHPRMLGDVNGDGLPDVVGFGEDGVYVSTSTGSGLTAPTQWIPDFGVVAGGWDPQRHLRMLGDVNGDGRQDVVGFGTDGVWVALSTGGSFGPTQLWSADFGFDAGGWRVDMHPRALADINGDGRQDVVGFANEGVFVATSTGAGFRQPRLWIDDFGFDAGGWRIDEHVRLLGDITGDGRDDIVAFGDYGVFVLRSGIPVAFE